MDNEWKGDEKGNMYDGYDPEWIEKCDCLGDFLCEWHWRQKFCIFCGKRQDKCICGVYKSKSNELEEPHYIIAMKKKLEEEEQEKQRRERRKAREKRCKDNNIDMYNSDESENSYPLDERKDYMYHCQRCPFLPTQERLSMKKNKD